MTPPSAAVPAPAAAAPPAPSSPPRPGLGRLLRPYRRTIAGLVVLTIAGNALNLLVPRIIARAIDAFAAGEPVIGLAVRELMLASIGIFVFTWLQTLVQTYASERVARDLRTRLAARISRQDHAYIQQLTPAALLTHLTSDVDAIKTFVSQAIASLICLGVPDHRRGDPAAVDRLAARPGGAGDAAGDRRNVLPSCSAGSASCSPRSQEAIDWLNKVINESILGASLIRLVNSQQAEYDKFLAANTEARDIGLGILRLFAGLIPVIIFATNLATLAILALGGHFVIDGSMTLGDFAAFNTYLAILIFPMIMIGFMSNVDGAGERLLRPHRRRARRAGPAARRRSLPRALRGDIAVAQRRRHARPARRC